MLYFLQLYNLWRGFIGNIACKLIIWSNEYI